MDTHLPTTDPAHLHRTPCPVGDRLVLCGDLHHDPAIAAEQLDEWQAFGVRGIVDCREEWNDRALVREHAPGLRYRHVGTDDEGQGQSDAWFDRGVGATRDLLALGPDAKVLIHCHMGVNRGPSLGLAVLLDLGWELIAALDAIRAARPIAAIAYAEDAARWHLRRIGAIEDDVVTARQQVRAWHDANDIDVESVIGRIRRAG